MLASAEVVVHQPARNAGRTRDVLNPDRVVAMLGEQGFGCVEDLSSPFRGFQTVVSRCHAHHTTRLLAIRQYAVSIVSTRLVKPPSSCGP